MSQLTAQPQQKLMRTAAAASFQVFGLVVVYALLLFPPARYAGGTPGAYLGLFPLFHPDPAALCRPPATGGIKRAQPVVRTNEAVRPPFSAVVAPLALSALVVAGLDRALRLVGRAHSEL